MWQLYCSKIDFESVRSRNSLAVQWLGLHPFTAGAPDWCHMLLRLLSSHFPSYFPLILVLPVKV